MNTTYILKPQEDGTWLIVARRITCDSVPDKNTEHWEIQSEACEILVKIVKA